MKELSIEEKAKRFDEALAKAKAFAIDLPNGRNDRLYHIWDLETIFPELKENKDEKIRKALIRFHKSTIDIDGIKGEDILAWLEKQKVLTAEEYLQGKEDVLWCIKQAEKHAKDENEMGTCWFAEKWLEKQGDITKLSEEEQNRFAKGVLSSCAMSFIDYLDAHNCEGKMCVSNGDCADIENAFHNDMWDKLHRYYCKYIEKQDEQTLANSTKACKDEQNPTDKIEPKFKVGDTIKCKYDDRQFTIKSVDLDKGTYTYTQEGCGNDIDYADENFEIVGLKPAWGEEDAEMVEGLNNCLDELEEKNGWKYVYVNDKNVELTKVRNWLKLLKERVACEANCTTTKQRSEDEESIINKAESWLDTLCDYLKDSSPEYISDIKDVINRLKSIKDRYAWKPSSIQMECLHDAIEHYHTNGYPATKLTELYEQLSKIYKL